MFLIQYVGFHARVTMREYSYRIVDPSAGERTVILTITNEAFQTKLVRYQDAPTICYQKVKKELEAETSSHPLRGRMALSEAELSEYRAAHPLAKR